MIEKNVIVLLCFMMCIELKGKQSLTWHGVVWQCWADMTSVCLKGCDDVLDRLALVEFVDL